MDSKYNPDIVEDKIRKFWEKEKIFAFDSKSKKPIYSIDTPPPTVSGDIHLGHIFSYSQAEFIARYKRMRGYNVFYPFGLDNNGLPTELLIEKKFNVVAEDLGREKFTELEKKEVKVYNDKYIELWKTLGLSVDWSLLYQTISDDVQKVSQKSFLELHKMGRVYKKEAPVLFCPKDKTVVSQMELKDKMLKSKLFEIKFSNDVTIATSRPELLPACVAIFVNPQDKKHSKLIGKEVKVPLFGNTVKVIGDEKVDPSFGTGVVMCCTFGDTTDIDWYKQYNLPLKIVIDEKGRMKHEKYKGMKIKEAREKIVEELKEKGLIVKEQELEHSVNVHERCDTEIEFIVKEQWYLKYLDLKEKFIELGRKINWYPEFMRTRYENWVNGLHWDWSIARQRYVGIYFPVWYCKKCGETIFAREEDLPVNPFVDKPKEKCAKCGSSEFLPETDIMDTWATSSLTPLINARWGLDNKYEQIFPMGLRAQAHDIITFWAFTTIVKSYLHKGTIPWKDIMISGHGLDPKGKPMHKSQGNVMYPEPYLKKYGADALRYWASSSILGEDNSFQEKEVVSGSRLINKLWNLGRLIDMNDVGIKKEKSHNPIDLWILSELNSVIEAATRKFDNYDYYGAKTLIENFFWDFANDYVEFIKHRIYKDDEIASSTMAVVYLQILKMLSPFIPFVTEELYQSLFLEGKNLKSFINEREKSIHITKWPEFDKSKEDAKDFARGEKAVKIIRFIRRWKHDNKLALNAPIKEITLSKKLEKELGDAVEDIKGAMAVAKVDFDVGELQVEEGIEITIRA